MGMAQAVVEKDLGYICRGLEAEFTAMAGKQLLIVGGAGFLGYYMVQSILHWNEQGDSAPIGLTVYDNYIRGIPTWLSDLEGHEHLTITRHDITQPLPRDPGNFQFIIHAASIASPTYYRKHPIETMDANVNGLRALLEYARAQKNRGHPLEGFLFFSTSEIYGDPSPDNIPTPETYRGNVSPTGPRACYDESKRYGETLCVNFAQQYELPIKIARPFNNYGPGLKLSDRRVLPDFARDLFAGRDIVLLSNGSPRRTFCYIADAVIGYYKILVRGRAGEAYNIGNESPEISMSELAELLVTTGQKIFGYDGRVVRNESDDSSYLIDNPQRRCPVIDKARMELGFNPEVALEEGLHRTLSWYEDNQDTQDR